MQTTVATRPRTPFAEISEIARRLKAKLQSRRGVQLRLQVSAAVGGQRSHVAWHQWDGKRDTLAQVIDAIKVGAQHLADVEVALCATHASVSAQDDARESITTILFPASA